MEPRELVEAPRPAPQLLRTTHLREKVGDDGVIGCWVEALERHGAGEERAALVSRADALSVNRDASDMRADELAVDEAVAHQLADDDVASALALPPSSTKESGSHFSQKTATSSYALTRSLLQTSRSS